MSVQQQLFLNTIQIVPATMEDVLFRLQGLLSTPNIEDTLLANIIKSLFFGLWNFDKMINQHNLSTRISELLIKIPRKNALIFLKAMLVHLHQKWNLIDHHRINKFMQLVRYLLVHAFKLCDKHKISRKKIDDILLETVYDPKLMQNGLIFHVTDIYFQLVDESLSNGATLDDLKMFEDLLLRQPSEHLRLYIIEHVYEKYKEKFVQQNEQDTEKLEKKVQEFAGRFLELARKEEQEQHRKNLYAIVGYAKSEHLSFSFYMQQKQLKAKAEEQKKKKKLTKGKKKEVKQLKQKRKEKKKGGKKTKKIMSVRKFVDKRGKFKKGIEQL